MILFYFVGFERLFILYLVVVLAQFSNKAYGDSISVFPFDDLKHHLMGGNNGSYAVICQVRG